MQHLDLFAGIGGFALAARRVGWQTVAFCEVDPYCCRVLRKHWPGVPVYGDIHDVTATRLAADGIAADVITGGFPCQDISVAGRAAGIDGEQSGLWAQQARIIGEVRPRYAVVENVTALLARGMERVTGDLAAIGYDCEWHCIPASAVGAPHRRDRIWIVAYPDGRFKGRREQQKRQPDQRDSDLTGHGPQGHVADAARLGVEGHRAHRLEVTRLPLSPRVLGRYRSGRGADQWGTEPGVGRVADGIPARVDRLKGLGNAIVPANAVVIFEAIIEFERARVASG